MKQAKRFKPADKLKLAVVLFDLGGKSKDNAGERCALLRKTAELATEDADVALVLRAVDQVVDGCLPESTEWVTDQLAEPAATSLVPRREHANKTSSRAGSSQLLMEGAARSTAKKKRDL